MSPLEALLAGKLTVNSPQTMARLRLPPLGVAHLRTHQASNEDGDGGGVFAGVAVVEDLELDANNMVQADNDDTPGAFGAWLDVNRDVLELRARDIHGANWRNVAQRIRRLVEAIDKPKELTLDGFATHALRLSLLDAADAINALGGLEVLRVAWLAINDANKLDIDHNALTWLHLAFVDDRVLWAIATRGALELPK